MPIQTDLSLSPYFDDFNTEKNFYKVLFQPGVAVQARELNQLQTILQNQIEKFGDNILKKGTVVDGCNITYHSRLPYVKIKDVETTGAPVNVDAYKDLYVKNSANLQAVIIKTAPGLEASNPNLNTLYVRYQNSGDNFEYTQFEAGDILTVFDPKNPIFKVNVINGSSGFSNSDQVVITSAIAVQNSVGGNTFTGFTVAVNDYVKNAGVATGQVVEVNTSIRTDAVVLRIKPLPEDLRTSNSALWTFYQNDSIEIYKFSNPTSKIAANKIVSTYGYGAEASLITDSLGKVASISITNGGSEYDVEPYVSISSKGAVLSDISLFDAQAQRYLTTVSIAASNFSPVGYGYGMTVSDGVIYQKGFFTRVEEQLTIIEKYANTGFNKSVGFYTNEELINSNVDTSLLDNATGTPNYTAPGADRLKLTPTLVVLDELDAVANNEFFPIVDFSLGSPYKQTKQTMYSTIGDMIANRTFEESGNYVLDTFSVTTKDSANVAKTANAFNIYIDPGTAYINGYRVKTDANYIAEVDKGVDFVQKPDTIMTMEYGSYFRVNELGGVFNFAAGDIIEFYDTAKTYVSTLAGSDITAAGTKIGQARIRALTYEYGEASPGSPFASYKMYVFDLQFNSRVTAESIKSIYYPGTTKGICDVILEDGVAKLYDAKNSSMLFKSIDSTRSLENVSYIYRNSTLVTSISNNGIITVANGVNETFPYTSTGAYLSDLEESTITVTPLVDISAVANAGGAVATSTTTKVLTGTSTTFTTSFVQGDYIRIANTSTSFVGQIARIANNTSLTLVANSKLTFTTANTIVYYPKNVAIPLTRADTKRAKVTTSPPIGRLQIELGTLATGTSANAVVEYNIRRNFDVVPKTAVRGAYARVLTANNDANTVGPWALGVADVFRLRNVYKANTANINNAINSTTAVASNNFISIANNAFSNGDVVTYTRPASNTANIGLTNATSYYVVTANTSAIQLSTSYGGSVVPVFANATTETHYLAGRPILFTPNSFGVTDVTNEFYIDSNQQVDYLDTSYLYRKQNLEALGSDVGLLVKFDVFVTTSDGIKTISSYEIDDTKTFGQYEVSTKINTLEVPELYDNVTGKYYDLRDQLDLRPVSANTIAIINTSAAWSNTSIINPREPVDGVFANASFNALTAVSNTDDFITISSNPFASGDAVVYTVAAGNTAITPLTNNSLYYIISANSTGVKLSTEPSGSAINLTAGTSQTGHVLSKTMLRFSQSTKFFPLPGTTGSANISHYQGRIDRVALTSDGRFRVIKGTPGVYDRAPLAPNDAMTINILSIPPYPSLPFALSSDTAKIIDTKTTNDKPSARISNYRIMPQMSASDISSSQIKPYRMSDIASLERRISTLEYYVSVTLAETVAKSRFIPSSSNANIDRFKFGFFVDSFSSASYADTTNPLFNSTITNDKLMPKTDIINLEFTFDLNSDGLISESLASFIDEEFTLIEQTDATALATTGAAANTAVTANVVVTSNATVIEVPTITQEIVTATGSFRSSARNNNGTVWEDWTYVFSSLPGVAQIFVNARDQNVKISVFQSATPGDVSGNPIITTDLAQPLSSADKAFGGGAYGVGNTKHEDLNRNSGGWVEDSFKLTWNHNPVNGQYYTIRVFKGSHNGELFGNYGVNGFYAFRLYYPTDKIGTTTRTVAGPNSFDYQGSVYSQVPQTFTFSQPTTWIDLGYFGEFSLPEMNLYLNDAQKFDIVVTGLRPLTRHFFYFDDVDKTTNCSQLRTDSSAGAAGLVSDSNGVLSFSFYFDAGIDEAAGSDFARQNQLAAQLAGIKTYRLTNVDGTSNATGTIDLKYYANSTVDGSSAAGINVPTSTQSTGPSSTQVSIENKYQSLKWIQLNEQFNDEKLV